MNAGPVKGNRPLTAITIVVFGTRHKVRDATICIFAKSSSFFLN
jgi:hypothetical protein